MTDSFIEVVAGGVDIEDGTYAVILSAIDGPKTIHPKSGPNAGEEVQIIDWIFNVDEPGEDSGTEVRATSSTASGPMSKMFDFLTALRDGKPPAIGARIEKSNLIGRRALAKVGHNANGWARVESLTALPASMRHEAF